MDETIIIPKLLKASEVAGHLHLAASYVYRLAQQGKIPSARIGKRVLFLETDVYEFIYGCKNNQLENLPKLDNQETQNP
jgi:excisionase family DNA binding protein